MKKTVGIYMIFALLVVISYAFSLGNGLVSDDIEMANQVKTWGASYIFSKPTFLRDVFPKFSDSWYYYGILAEDMGNLALAEQNYQNALRFNPSYEPARERLAKLIEP